MRKRTRKFRDFSRVYQCLLEVKYQSFGGCFKEIFIKSGDRGTSPEVSSLNCISVLYKYHVMCLPISTLASNKHSNLTLSFTKKLD